MRTFHGVAQIEAAVGDHLGTSGWHHIDQARIDAFAAVSGDHQWIHVDPARAAATEFGCTIAHGYLTLALTTAFANEVYRIEGVARLMNYGLNRVRFTAPVPVDSDVRGSIELRAVQRTGSAVRVMLDVAVERRGSARPVCVGEMVLFVDEN